MRHEEDQLLIVVSGDALAQLVNDETTTCWSASFGTSDKNGDSDFKASTP